jgi:hypothetical protein
MSDNINVTVLGRFFSGGFLRQGRLRENARTLLKEFDVRPPLAGMDYGFFSGGTSRGDDGWPHLPPQILLLHEPTGRGHRRSRVIYGPRTRVAAPTTRLATSRPSRAADSRGDDV